MNKTIIDPFLVRFEKIYKIDEKGRKIKVLSDQNRSALFKMLKEKGLSIEISKIIVNFADRYFNSYKSGKIKIKPNKGITRQWEDFQKFMNSKRPSKSIMIFDGRNTFKFNSEGITNLFDEAISYYKRLGVYDSEPSSLGISRWELARKFLEEDLVDLRTSKDIKLLNKVLSTLADDKVPSSQFHFEYPLPKEGRLGEIKTERQINTLTYEILEVLGIVLPGTKNAMNSFIKKHTREV